MIIIFTLGMICTLCGGLAIVWSILVPSKRVWPLKKLTALNFIGVWAPTLLAFGACIILGILDWNAFDLPALLRYGLGVPLIIAGHVAVYFGAKTIGLKATSGAPSTLRVGGIYRFSRNPQYMADISSLIGWGIVCASMWATPIIIGIIIVFILTPFAEEPWLLQNYGKTYKNYQKTTPRFF